MVPIAILNGLARETWYGRTLSELRSHQLSTLAALVLFGVYMWVVMDVLQPSSSRQALNIGLVWMVLTLAFEFMFGHFVAGTRWTRLLREYDVFHGRLWPLVPAWIALAPLIFYKLKR